MEIIKKHFGIDPRMDSNVQAFAEDFRVADALHLKLRVELVPAES